MAYKAQPAGLRLRAQAQAVRLSVRAQVLLPAAVAPT
jgi:hypothetical protein